MPRPIPRESAWVMDRLRVRFKMCGIVGIFGDRSNLASGEAMVSQLQHRGPDAEGIHVDPSNRALLGHTRLSILDLSAAGSQPMSDCEGRYWIAFNGEIYNYTEFRRELTGYPFRSETDTEVILAAYRRWGERCLDRFIGMFAMLIWDEQEQTLFGARDRFGVKPFYYSEHFAGTLMVASEIQSLHAGGVPRNADPSTWSTYLSDGVYDHSERTFWQEVKSLPPGHQIRWRKGAAQVSCWYDLADRVGTDFDTRSEEVVGEEYLALLCESIRLRFRSDVPVGINLSGGLDSSTLLGVVQAVHGEQCDVQAFTFVTGDDRYDESPWVQRMLKDTRHPWIECRLSAQDVPQLAMDVQRHQAEPFGGLPTLAYARVFAEARQRGVIVLLDGQGMDEQWAGYDYYRKVSEQQDAAAQQISTVQGTLQRSTRPECLHPEFRQLAASVSYPQPFPDSLRNIQYRDARYTKIPRALRFNDRISMQFSTELREPFLDHRLFELAFRQPAERKISRGTGKRLLRDIVDRMLPTEVVEAPKRALQTPQREWLREDLKEWAEDCIHDALKGTSGSWLDERAVTREWTLFQQGASDNSFYIWQWINLGLCSRQDQPSNSAASFAKF